MTEHLTHNNTGQVETRADGATYLGTYINTTCGWASRKTETLIIDALDFRGLAGGTDRDQTTQTTSDMIYSYLNATGNTRKLELIRSAQL